MSSVTCVGHLCPAASCHPSGMHVSGQQGEPTLVASFPPDCWVACVVETEPTLWCPIVEFGEPRRALGLARTGDWVWGLRRNGPDNLYRLGGPSLVGVLPILEVPLPMIREEARRAAEAKGISTAALLGALPSEVTSSLRSRHHALARTWVLRSVSPKRGAGSHWQRARVVWFRPWRNERTRPRTRSFCRTDARFRRFRLAIRMYT